MGILATHYDLFLVAFQGVSQQFIFSGEVDGELGDLIKTHSKTGIEFIKRFDKSKSKFQPMSKPLVKQLFSYDTHSILQLQKINFIK